MNDFSDEYDDRALKNQYSDPDAIDERQCVELLILLDRWEKKEIEPWDVLLEASHISGARPDFLTSYHISRRHNLDHYTAFLDGTLIETSDNSYLQYKFKSAQEHKRCLNDLKALLRPEMLNRKSSGGNTARKIQSLRNKIENAEYDSWSATGALAEILLLPHDEALDDPDDFLSPLDSFIEAIKEEGQRVFAQAPNPTRTVSLFAPETEASIKASLASFFAEQESKKNERESENGEPIVPLDYPDRKLCNGLEIVPSGTGLIEVYEQTEYDEPFERDIYGTKVARITTYSVSFIPKTPEDLPLLQEIVSKALNVLGTVPYKYELPGHTLHSGESYKRIRNPNAYFSRSDTVASAYVGIEGGKVQPLARFDLDDLWVLFYLLEPIIEPNAQIAAAMNAARYAEERGAILDPHPFDFLDRGHKVTDKSCYLKDTKPEELLQKTLLDCFVDLALRNTDEAGFMLRLTTLADHILMGRIEAPQKHLPTYDRMIANAQERKGDVVPYQDALTKTTKTLICGILGLPPDSTKPLYTALESAIREIATPLREHHRQETRRKEEALWETAFARIGHNKIGGKEITLESLREEIDQKHLKQRLSDFVSGKTYVAPESDGPTTHAVTQKANLVVAESEVETCLDGLHAGGRYVSRTQNSPFVRKELPSALQPFCPTSDNRPDPNKLLSTTSRLLSAKL